MQRRLVQIFICILEWGKGLVKIKTVPGPSLHNLSSVVCLLVCGVTSIRCFFQVYKAMRVIDEIDKTLRICTSLILFTLTVFVQFTVSTHCMCIHSNNIGMSVDIAVGCMQGYIVQHHNLLHGFIHFKLLSYLLKLLFNLMQIKLETSLS